MEEPFIYSPPAQLPIVHVDKDIVVVNKPSGLLSVPGREHKDSALTRLEKQFGHVYDVHRLDMDTSGLLLFALRRNAERALKEQFRERRVSKYYLALVHGALTKDRTIDLPLKRLDVHPPRSAVDTSGKAAQTEVKRIAHDERFSLLQLRPITGRSHQLRVHLQAIGHPIVGDRFYGPQPAIGQLCLQAQQLCFAHPWSGAELRFVASSPVWIERIEVSNS